LDSSDRLEDQLSSMFATVSEVRAAAYEATGSYAPEFTPSASSNEHPEQVSERPARLEDRLAALSATISEVRAAVEHVSSSRTSLSRCSSLAASLSIPALTPPCFAPAPYVAPPEAERDEYQKKASLFEASLQVRSVVDHGASSACTTSLSRASSLATSIAAPNEGYDTAEDYELATAADLEAVYQKSEDLVRAMTAVDCGEEVQHQWAALMMKNEDYKDRIARIEQLVARRAQQLSSGDDELRLCRAVRGLCVGSQKPGRRWSIIS
jgi:hypothetical protein